MQRLQLRLHLKSDTTFGRGEGLAGLVDEEIEYDVATGLPFIRGRMLKGLLVEECANVLFALQMANTPALYILQASAERLFGRPGSDLQSAAMLHFGPAQLPQELQSAVCAGIEHGELKPAAVLEALTSIRRQTSIDEVTAASEKGSLRSMRVVLRKTSFRAWLDFAYTPGEDDLALLAACALSIRHGGTGRNRGRGRLELHLFDEQGSDVTIHPHFQHFEQIVMGGQI